MDPLDLCPACGQELPGPHPKRLTVSIGASPTPAHGPGDHLSAPRPSGPVRIQFVVTGNMDNVVEQEFIEAVERSIGLVGLRLGITGGDIMWSR